MNNQQTTLRTKQKSSKPRQEQNPTNFVPDSINPKLTRNSFNRESTSEKNSADTPKMIP